MEYPMKKIKILAVAFMMFCFGALHSGIAAADVPLGPGDVVKISVFGNDDLKLETRISEAGSITFPLIGEVRVGGLSTGQAETKIADMLDKGGFIRSPQVNILVSEMQSQQVSVLGQVNMPGRYPVDGKRSLTDIIAVAGGLTEEAGDTVVLVRTRDGKTTKDKIDMDELMRSSDPSKNPQLTTGDSVYVERAPRFYIYGEVQKPGSYKLERNMIVLQALSAGGGLSPRGTERGVRIKRRDANGELHVINVKHDDLVKADDIVYVKESLF
jgi:polysaccharide biosynthesis/export protein